ncbi:hypothetical protein SHK09_01775 [Polaribacter sp. PL03]|uniref:hypothetical protein n=1 Tax=Polaribacter sp. PL03 TaxID=3088353 RepID=UPI0029CD3754|nr:hypothetical protein [Polaribacter sp. PL03]MDX6745505.1 hypothetical protein [Polaribacter sp. PL03]
MQKVLNANKLVFIWICFVILSCSSAKEITDENQINVLNTIIQSSKSSIYYKTINNNGTSFKKPIEEYITDNLEFQFCETYIIKENDIVFLRKEFKKLKVKNLYKLPSIYKKNITKEKKSFETSFISIPILFRNNTMAIYYSTETYGGSLTLLQKRNSKWETICSSSVWIE